MLLVAEQPSLAAATLAVPVCPWDHQEVITIATHRCAVTNIQLANMQAEPAPVIQVSSPFQKHRTSPM